MPFIDKKRVLDSIISIVPLEVRKRNLLASIICAVLILISFHLITIDVSTDKDLDGEITLLETQFKFKSLGGDNIFNYALAALLASYALCIPIAINYDDV